MLPILDGVFELIAAGAVPGGTKRNLAHALAHTVFADSLTETQRLIAADAQTSGGLLIVLPAAQAEPFADALRAAGTLASAILGEIIPSNEPRLYLES